MSRPTLEVADIFRRHGPAYRRLHRLPRQQRRLMRAIELCRTAALGGHVDRCTHCAHLEVSYNSCRNRHCPKCQTSARMEWVQARKDDLLPIAYFHVVFTLPDSIAAIAFHNPAVVYSILFRAASQTLLTIARDPRHLGAEIGFFAILHTWGQNLLLHPHLHCVATGGGLSPDAQWVSCRPGFFLPVRVLSRLFRRLFCHLLEKAFRQDRLQFFSDLAGLAHRAAFTSYLKKAQKQEWVVYAKPPFGGPPQVIEYLGRYTHRVAISNHRLLALKDNKVSFHYKDYRRQGRQKVMTIEAAEFIRRFLLHTLAPGFQRIRHYGLLANVHCKEKLALCRRLLRGSISDLLPLSAAADPEMAASLAAEAGNRCPRCGIGLLQTTHWLMPLVGMTERIDSS